MKATKSSPRKQDKSPVMALRSKESLNIDLFNLDVKKKEIKNEGNYFYIYFYKLLI